MADNDLMTIREASLWASKFLGKAVSNSNISYLIQYGRVQKFTQNGSVLVDRNELAEYYNSSPNKREVSWKKELGDDLNWGLSFDHLREVDTTKHVHRLHPYKGKFIPQLVEYFLDDHIDGHKLQTYFQRGDVILDPFCGSGTTLVQANELGYNAIGIDVSGFNTLMSNVKVRKHDLIEVFRITKEITKKLRLQVSESREVEFENELLSELAGFNTLHFPSPEFKYKVKNHEIDEDEYGAEKSKQFMPIFRRLAKKYQIDFARPTNGGFLDTWYIEPVRAQIHLVFDEIRRLQNSDVKKVLSVILSRTIRSCRATTHSDLATLKEPVLSTYYCSKHGKICKPLFSILGWWQRYSEDTVKRLTQFDEVRTQTHQICVTGDSRSIDLYHELSTKHKKLHEIVVRDGIAGIFTSPPYVGLIDYHEQHAYAYDLFGFDRHDELEIGPMFKGQGREAQRDYIKGIAAVILNLSRYLKTEASIFIVANDKFGIYSQIAANSGLNLVEQFKRPVLNRTERDKSAYSESIMRFVLSGSQATEL